LWRGPALAEFAFEDFARPEAARLDELRLVAIEDRIEARLTLGHHAELVGELEALVDEHPFRERLWAQLMLALYRARRQREALRAFGRLKALLGEELGIEPSASLRNLEQAIVLQESELDWTAPPGTGIAPTVADAAGTSAPVLGNLPLQVSSIIGRERDMARAVDALAAARLVTLTGTGGVGKTRLACQVAAEVSPGFREGAWLVELAPVRGLDAVIDAVAAVFGVSERVGLTLAESLVEFFRSKRLLLVVDNCEHVLERVGGLVADLLGSCAGVVVLATSRDPLAIGGEQALLVAPLRPPADGADVEAIAGSAAVQLFVERARARNADFVLDASNAAAVATIVAHLDGVPLAIELAAARMNAMSPAELAAALQQRQDLLGVAHRRGDERHQTLRASVDWSYELLDASGQRLLARLSVFSGGFTREAAESVCAGETIADGTVFALLADLVSGSLVVADRAAAETRYRLLETIREYGEARLAEFGEVAERRDRHARYFVERAVMVCAGLRGPGQIVWGHRLHADHANFIAAMTHALDTGDAATAVELLAIVPLAPQLGRRLPLDARPVLELPGAQQHPAYPWALMVAAEQARARGEFAEAEQLIKEALDADPEGKRPVPAPGVAPLDVMAAETRSTMAAVAGRFEDAARTVLEAADGCRAAGIPALAAGYLASATLMLSMAGDLDAAIPIGMQGLELARASGMPTPIVANLSGLAQAHADREPERARAFLDEALALNASLGYEHQNELLFMALAAARLGDWSLTARLAGRAIALLHWTGDRSGLPLILTLAARALADGDPEGAATTQGLAVALGRATAAVTPSNDAPNTAGGRRGTGGFVIETDRETTRILSATLGDDRLRLLRDEVAARDFDDAVASVRADLDQLATSAANDKAQLESPR
jgi:predicted ATPase